MLFDVKPLQISFINAAFHVLQRARFSFFKKKKKRKWPQKGAGSSASAPSYFGLESRWLGWAGCRKSGVQVTFLVNSFGSAQQNGDVKLKSFPLLAGRKKEEGVKRFQTMQLRL